MEGKGGRIVKVMKIGDGVVRVYVETVCCVDGRRK